MRNTKYIFIGVTVSIAVFLAYGIPTALIPTGLFKRMLAPSITDYIFLIAISAMIGTYISLHLYGKEKHMKSSNREDYTTVGGATIGIFAVSCPICNVLIVLLLGSSAALVYFEPLRPFIGIIAITVLGIALYLKIKKCSECKIKN